MFYIKYLNSYCFFSFFCYNVYVTRYFYYTTIGGKNMSRFTEFKYDEEKWELVFEDILDKQCVNVGHMQMIYLRNLSTNNMFYLHPSIRCDNFIYNNVYIGLEQISDNKFLEYYQTQFSCELIEHYFDENGVESQKIHQGGKSFVSLDDDKIWLQDWHVYSITAGCFIETLKPFDNLNTELTLKVDSNGNNFLYVKMQLSSHDYGKDYLLFVFDAKTFLLALPVYSSLRDSFIELSDSFTITDLIKEEKKYKDLITICMESVNNSFVKKAEESLLSDLIDKA